MVKKFLAGFDISGGELRGYLVDPRSGALLENLLGKDIDSSSITSNNELTQIIEDSVKKLGKKEEIGIGLEVCGVVDEKELIVRETANFSITDGKITTGKDLKNKGYKVTKTNDMRAEVVGFYYWGQLKGINNGGSLTLSTGANYAIIRDGKITSFAEAGHEMDSRDIDFCGCGSTGCIEPKISKKGAIAKALNYFFMKDSRTHPILMNAMDRIYKKEQKNKQAKELLRTENKFFAHTLMFDLDVTDIYKAYRQDPTQEPQRSIRNYQRDNIARFFGKIISHQRPLEKIVCKGSLSTKCWDEVVGPAKDIYLNDPGKYHLSSIHSPEIVKCTTKKPGVVGAAAYFLYKNPDWLKK